MPYINFEIIEYRIYRTDHRSPAKFHIMMFYHMFV